MRRLKCKKYVVGFIIVLCACVGLFSTNLNANASELSLSANFVTSTANSTVDSWSSTCGVKITGASAYVQNNSSSEACSVSQMQHPTGFDSFGWRVNNEYYLKVVGQIYEVRDREPLNTAVNGTASLTVYYTDGESDFAQFVSLSTEYISDSSTRIEWLYKLTSTSRRVIKGYVMTGMGINLKPNEYFKMGGYILYTINNVNVNTTVNVDTQSIVDAIKNADSAQAINNQTQKIEQQTEVLKEQQKKDEEDRNSMTEASDDANDSADSSGEQAEETGATLLQAFSSFIDALNSASASDCNINFNVMGYLKGGTVNLCSLQIPSQLQIISSLILIGFCVPLSMATARKVISLFRSFQG